jgi:hypothetical protein
MCRRLLFLTWPGLALLLSGCGELKVTYSAPASTPTPPPPVVVTVSPAAASVNGLKSQLFTAAVSGTSNTAVTWSVSGASCSGTSCGSIAPNGVYKAPATLPSPAIVTITATSVADTAKSATASVTVLPALPVEVAVTPRTATVLANKSVNLAALVTNTLNTAVSWSVAGSGCTGVACGTISASGAYTAPVVAPSPGTVTVTATSQADPSKTDQATIIVVDTAEALITGTYTYLLNAMSFGGGFAAVGSRRDVAGGGV